jgi:hypothetical protein
VTNGLVGLKILFLGVCQCASKWERKYMEAEKLIMFPRSALERCGTSMVAGTPSAEVLAHPTSFAVHEWLRSCPHPAEEDGGSTARDRDVPVKPMSMEEVAAPDAPMVLADVVDGW